MVSAIRRNAHCFFIGTTIESFRNKNTTVNELEDREISKQKQEPRPQLLDCHDQYYEGKLLITLIFLFGLHLILNLKLSFYAVYR